MSSNHTLLLTILVFFLGSIFCNVTPAFGSKTHADSWIPVKNLNGPKLVKIGKFAVGEHNNKANSNLMFDKVVKAEIHQGYGIEYNLTIVAKDGARNDKPKTYVTVVVYDQFMDSSHLVSFKGPIYV
ncbi:putative Cystatin domain-containing protein [Helianthus anomalus]